MRIAALAVVQGLWYGAKIRFPHALVMTFLFRSGSLTDKFRDIFSATWQHSRNLACYVSIYKLVCCLMRHFRGVESPLNSLVGGAIGGAAIFGANTPVNAQINMYVMSRVIIGGVKAASANGLLPAPGDSAIPHIYTLYGAVTWAAVMYLFEFQQKHLQRSLTTSMTYLYHESNVWPQINDSSVIDWFLG